MRTWGMGKEVRKDSMKVIKWEKREDHPDRRGSIRNLEICERSQPCLEQSWEWKWKCVYLGHEVMLESLDFLNRRTCGEWT